MRTYAQIQNKKAILVSLGVKESDIKKQLPEYAKIQVLQDLGFSDEEIQQKFDFQNSNPINEYVYFVTSIESTSPRDDYDYYFDGVFETMQQAEEYVQKCHPNKRTDENKTGPFVEIHTVRKNPTELDRLEYFI